MNKILQALENKVSENLKKAEISFYVLRDLINEVNSYPLQDINEVAKVLELLYKIYDEGGAKLTNKKDENNLLKETKKSFVSVAGFGLNKPIRVQEIILKVLSKKIANIESSEISAKTLSSFLEIEGTDTVLNADGKSISWRRFMIRLSPEIVQVRDRTMELLFEIVKTNQDKYDLIKNIITAYSSSIHSLEVRYRTDKSLTAEEKTELLNQIKKIISYLKQIKELYNDIKIEHLDIWHQISLAVWDPYEEKSAIKTDITEAEELKNSIWENNNYFLFKLILKPGHKSREKNPNFAGDFRSENISLLEQIVEFGEKEKTIHGSLKFFFRELGEKNSTVFKQMLKLAKENEKPYLWYYLGFGFSKIDESAVFAKDQEKSKNIVHIKAGIDAFYHTGESFGKCSNKNQVFEVLQSLIGKGNAIIKKDQKEIFWWSMSTAELLGRTKIETKEDARKIVDLFILLIDSGNQNLINNSIEWLSFIDDKYFAKKSLKSLFKHLPAPQPINTGYNYLLHKIAKRNSKLVMEYIIKYTSDLFQKTTSSFDTEINELDYIFESVDCNAKLDVFITLFGWFVEKYPSSNKIQQTWMKEAFHSLASKTNTCSINDDLNKKLNNKVFKKSKPYSLQDLEKVLRTIDPDIIELHVSSERIDLANIESICLLKLVINCRYICFLKQHHKVFFSEIDKILVNIEKTPDIHSLIRKTNKILSHSGTQQVRSFFDFLVEIFTYFDLIKNDFVNVTFISEEQSKKTPDLKASKKGKEYLIECKHLNRPYDEDLNLRVIGSYNGDISQDVASKLKNKICNGESGLLDSALDQLKKYNSKSNKILYLNFTPGIDVRLSEDGLIDLNNLCGEGYFKNLEKEHDINIVLPNFFNNWN